jgi:hypothetical protein
MAEPFPSYDELRRSHGGFMYGIYLIVKTLYEQVNSAETPKKKASKPKYK